MKKLAIAVALASTAMASPALATDGAWYIGLEGGPMIVEDIDLNINDTQAASIDHDYGYDFGGVIGYDFGAFRLEAEGSLRRADVKSVVATGLGIPSGATGTPVVGSYDINGRSDAMAFMVNGMFDFGSDDGLQGFVGGGAGVARVDLDYVFANNFLDDSDTGFAYQAIAGVRAPLTETIDVGLKYRFFTAPNVDLVDSLGRDIETRFRSHSILGSLIFNFGRAAAPVLPPVPAPAPPPPPPPPAPKPPVVVECTPGPYIVFFDWDKSAITPDAAGTLDNAVSAYNSGCSGTQVMLAGHTDTSGTAQYNVGLSQRRNDAVRGYLTSRGISGGMISSEAFGETQLRVQTLDGVRNDQNRRVEITYGPGSGM